MPAVTKLILLKRINPTVYEIHKDEISQGKNLLLTTEDKDFAECLVNGFNHYIASRTPNAIYVLPNNDIEEDYCSLEVSSLLKEALFRLPCDSFYPDKSWNEGNRVYKCSEVGRFDTKEILDTESGGWGNIIPRPTHSIAVKWIKYNYGTDIWRVVYQQLHFFETSKEVDSALLVALKAILYKKSK